MFYAWVVFHVIVCLALIIVVLLQSAKGEGLAGSAFGGAGGMGGAVFGGRGAASFLSNATTVLAVVFMANCIALAFMSASDRPVIGTTDSNVTSPITQAAQQEYERSQQAQQQRVADSIAAASGQDTSVSLENLVPAANDSN